MGKQSENTKKRSPICRFRFTPSAGEASVARVRPGRERTLPSWFVPVGVQATWFERVRDGVEDGARGRRISPSVRHRF